MDRRQAMALLQLIADCYLIVQAEDPTPEAVPAGSEVAVDLEPERNGAVSSKVVSG